MVAWDLGSMAYSWGYMPYANPYVVAVPQAVGVGVSAPYDYAQPIDVGAGWTVAVKDSAHARYRPGRGAQRPRDVRYPLLFLDHPT